MKNEEHSIEESNLKNLKERFDTLRRTGTPFVLHENQNSYQSQGMASGGQNFGSGGTDYRLRPSEGVRQTADRNEEFGSNMSYEELRRHYIEHQIKHNNSGN